jgi:hypothetical protein
MTGVFEAAHPPKAIAMKIAEIRSIAGLPIANRLAIF